MSWASEAGQKGQAPAAQRAEASTPAATSEGGKSRKPGTKTASAIACSASPAARCSATGSCSGAAHTRGSQRRRSAEEQGLTPSATAL